MAADSVNLQSSPVQSKITTTPEHMTRAGPGFFDTWGYFFDRASLHIALFPLSAIIFISGTFKFAF
jgi:hypothetical protein